MSFNVKNKKQLFQSLVGSISQSKKLLVVICVSLLSLNGVAKASDDTTALMQKAIEWKQTGARAYLLGKTLKEVNITALVNDVVNNNIDIKVSNIDLSKANSYIEQTEAAFNSIVNASWYYSRTETMLRREDIRRIRADKAPSNDTENFVLGCVFIDGVAVNSDLNDPATECFRVPSLTTETETASYSTSPSNVPNTYTMKLGVAKPFEIGSSINASISSKRNIKNSYAVSGLRGAMSASDPFGWGSRMPWTSTASINFYSPLPFTKGFGAFGSQSSLNKIIAVGQKISTEANKNHVRSTVLEHTLIGYWDLVRVHEELKSIITHRKVMEKRAIYMSKMLKIGRVIAYDVEQAKAELENLKHKEEMSWNAYINTSNLLLTSLDVELDTVLVPVAYEEKLKNKMNIDINSIRENSIKNNPELKIGAENLALSKANARYRQNQNRPDLSLSINYTAGQTDNVFGYKTWDSSLKEISHPDSNDLYIGLQYKLPFWKRAETAALSRTRIAMKQAGDSMRQIRNSIIRRTDDAVNMANSADILIRQTMEDLKLAQLAYKKALKLKKSELTTEFEVLNKFNDVLTAKLANISSKTNYRKAVVQILSIQGILDEHFKGLGIAESKTAENGGRS